MWWKYFSRRNCRKYDNVRYITCKSLYKDTKDKSTKEKIKQKTKIQKKKLKEKTKDKIAKEKFQENKRNKKQKTQDKQLAVISKTSSCDW